MAVLPTLVLSVVTAVSGAAPALAQASAPQSEPRAPNVLVISVDALRREHLGLYGYERATSPSIDALFAQSVVFDNAFAPITRSLPAHVSLWTASWPHRHGVVAHGGIKNVFASSEKRRSAAELLTQRGAKTTAFVSSYLLGKIGGLTAGFGFVDEPPRADAGQRENVRTPAEITARAGRWLELQGKSPFALWAHFEAPAEPNEPAPEWVKRWSGDGRAGALIEARGIDPQRFQLGYPTLLVIRMLFPELEGTVTPTPDLPLPTIERSTFEALFDRYDADVRAVDDAVGALLARLETLGLSDSTVVVFVGAYGQSLGERGNLGGGETTLENARAPLAIRFPASFGIAPRRVAGLASTIDALPTALAPGFPQVAAALAAQGDGRNLLAEGAQREFVLTQRTKRENARNDPGPIYAWRSDEWTYVHRPELSDYLFDRRADPNERESLFAKQPERVSELRPRVLAAFGLAK